jgi:hypothetical protein
MTRASRDDIIALERAYWDAIMAKDGDRTSELAGETSLTTGAHGVLAIAKATMGKMTEEGNWSLDAYEFSDVEVVTPAENVAIIAYTVTQKVTMGGKSRELRAADSSTWIRGPRGWECHAHSESFLQDNQGA